MNTSDIAHRAIPLHCDQCQHWGGWAPILVGGVEKYDVHGLCDSPKHCRLIADPAHGCSLWTPKAKTPNP